MQCQFCSSEFKQKKHASHQKYCSPLCGKKDRLSGLEYKCKTCHKTYKPNSYCQNFCSKSCSATFNNKGKRRHGLPPSACKTCGKGPLKASQRKYCSRRCFHEFRQNKLVQSWLQNEVSGSDANHGLRATFRNYLLEEANHKCTRCGWCEPNPKLGRPILTIDHINGDWKDNHRKNLVVICYNCHTLTPTFGALNATGNSYERVVPRHYNKHRERESNPHVSIETLV